MGYLQLVVEGTEIAPMIVDSTAFTIGREQPGKEPLAEVHARST
jgi:hypothetical protein